MTPLPNPTQLRRRIARFCDSIGMAESRFGRTVLNDPAFLHGLRQGRQPQARTVARVLSYIDGRG